MSHTFPYFFFLNTDLILKKKKKRHGVKRGIKFPVWKNSALTPWQSFGLSWWFLKGKKSFHYRWEDFLSSQYRQTTFFFFFLNNSSSPDDQVSYPSGSQFVSLGLWTQLPRQMMKWRTRRKTTTNSIGSLRRCSSSWASFAWQAERCRHFSERSPPSYRG